MLDVIIFSRTIAEVTQRRAGEGHISQRVCCDMVWEVCVSARETQTERKQTIS